MLLFCSLYQSIHWTYHSVQQSNEEPLWRTCRQFEMKMLSVVVWSRVYLLDHLPFSCQPKRNKALAWVSLLQAFWDFYLNSVDTIIEIVIMLWGRRNNNPWRVLQRWRCLMNWDTGESLVFFIVFRNSWENRYINTTIISFMILLYCC